MTDLCKMYFRHLTKICRSGRPEERMKRALLLSIIPFNTFSLPYAHILRNTHTHTHTHTEIECVKDQMRSNVLRFND